MYKDRIGLWEFRKNLKFRKNRKSQMKAILQIHARRAAHGKSSLLHCASLTQGPPLLDSIGRAADGASKDEPEKLSTSETSGCEYGDRFVNLAEVDHDTCAGISSPCPSLTSTSVDSSEYTQSCITDGTTGISTDYRLRLIALASSLVSFWYLHIRAEVLQPRDDHFRACVTGGQEANDRNALVGSGQSHQSASKDKSGKRKLHSLDQDNDDDEYEDGSIKRTKRNATERYGATNLLACPFNKCDPVRYSELNVNEKEYRGCASVYLSDVSRLK